MSTLSLEATRVRLGSLWQGEAGVTEAEVTEAGATEARVTEAAVTEAEPLMQRSLRQDYKVRGH